MAGESGAAGSLFTEAVVVPVAAGIIWGIPLVLGALAVSAGAWLASMPLVAHHFNLFNPVALLANVPVVVWYGGTGKLSRSLLLGVWLEPISVWFNHAAWFS